MQKLCVHLTSCCLEELCSKSYFNPPKGLKILTKLTMVGSDKNFLLAILLDVVIWNLFITRIQNFNIYLPQNYILITLFLFWHRTSGFKIKASVILLWSLIIPPTKLLDNVALKFHPDDNIDLESRLIALFRENTRSLMVTICVLVWINFGDHYCLWLIMWLLGRERVNNWSR